VTVARRKWDFMFVGRVVACILVLLGSWSASAADPFYFSNDVNGQVIWNLLEREKATLVVGKIQGCQQHINDRYYSAWMCDVVGAEFRIAHKNGPLVFLFKKMTLSKYPKSDPAAPWSINLYVWGVLKEMLPDGTELEVQTSVMLETLEDQMNKWRGRFSMASPGNAGTRSVPFVADIP
jgi:hypothetical protein